MRVKKRNKKCTLNPSSTASGVLVTIRQLANKRDPYTNSTLNKFFVIIGIYVCKDVYVLIILKEIHVIYNIYHTC